MSKEICEKIILASRNNKNIIIHINEFVDFLKYYSTADNIKYVTEREILETGLYAKIGDTNCYVSAIVQPGHIRVSDLENLPATSKALQLKLPLEQEEDNIRKYWSAETPIL